MSSLTILLIKVLFGRHRDMSKIISNNVYADVKNGVYKLLDNEFIGTFVTWEMNSSIFSI